MTDLEKEWLDKCKVDNRYIVQVDNDCIFVVDTEKWECVFEFDDYGTDFIVELLGHVGIVAEHV